MEKAESVKEEKTEENTCIMDISEDMYVGSLSTEIVGIYICMLCYGIVHKPVKCTNCQILICSDCVPAYRREGFRDKFKCPTKCKNKNCTQDIGL